MMANIYGVGAQHSAPRKGYSDFVQHTSPMVSGQLGVSLSDAQTLPVTFGYSQDQAANMQSANNSLKMFQRTKLSLAQILRNSLKVAQASRNLLMGHNYSESRELAKHEQYSGSEVPTKSTGSWRDGADLLHEKGRTANATLWDDCFFNHEENQHSPVLDDGRKPNLAYEENQYLAEPQDNYITLSDLVQRLQPSFSQSQNHTGISGEVQPWRRGVLQKFRKTSTGATYKIFVGDRVTGSKPVQPSGASLDFLRCSALSLRPQASSTQVEKFTLEPLSFSCSTLASISAVSSCGKRIPLYMVLLFMWFFAMLNLIECLNKGKITVKNGAMKLFKQNTLTCLNTMSNLFKQSDSIRMKIAKPSSVSSTDRASNHNVIGANTMACEHSTQTRPKFVFLFLGTPNEFPNTTPTVLRVEADTEDEGRAKFVGWTLIFAAQIRTEAPCRLQLFSTDEGFMWVYEQRQTVKDSSHA